MQLLTEEHLAAARMMPPKSRPLCYLSEDENKKRHRRQRRERNAIARYLWLRRRLGPEADGGPSRTRESHRYQIVRSSTEARTILKHLKPCDDTATTEKKANRGHLLRAAKKGQLWVRCRYHMTDDYASDASNKNGTMDDFAKVYFREETVSSVAEKIELAYHHGASHDDVKPLMEIQREEFEATAERHRLASKGMVSLRAWDFRTKSGHIRGTTTSGNFSIHSNLNYDYEIRN